MRTSIIGGFLAALFVLATAFVPLAVAAAPATDDRALLTRGVHQLVAPGALPGLIAVWGKQAFVVASGQTGRERAALFAAAHWDKGRVVAGGHGGFWDARALQNGDNARFLANIVRWAGGDKKAARILLVSSADGVSAQTAFLTALQAAGVSATVETVFPSDTHLAERLRNADVLFMGQDALVGAKDASQIAEVQAWVKKGGGLVMAGPAWGWQQLNPNKSLQNDHSGNRLLRPVGLAFADGTVSSGRGKQSGYAVPDDESPLLHAQTALSYLADRSRPLSLLETAQATQTVALVVGALPPSEDTGFAARVRALCASGNSGGKPVVPSRALPVTTQQPLVRLQFVLDAQELRRLPADAIKAHPAAASFPGVVPDDAPRLTQTVTVNLGVPDWHSTGLYAPPGAVITVSVPASAATKGLAVRIGAHKDTLWHLPKWERFPEITKEQKITNTTLRLASAFGGPVYVVVPEKSAAGTVGVQIAGAVAAPYFVRGKTSGAQWEMLRNAPAPWAELEGEKCILTVPSAVVRTLAAPDALMAYWDSVMDACADLYARPRTRTRPERYCVDRQISAGYMHSGYPIMTGDDVASRFCDLAVLTGKNGNKVWGFYHELGHNHQMPDWTFDGTGEVTNNLFSLYGCEVLNGATPPAHPALEATAARARLQKYLAGGAKWDEWKSDPFLALTMYAQLRQAFGWEPFTRVFAAYQRLAPREHPQTDDEKRDQWLTRFSRQVGKNLGPFFQAWGVPTSDVVRQSLNDLPVWMPEGVPELVQK